jgi:catechol 2,3-dioxygenase-like lactoylglutathione lyase family enzyme
MLTSSKVTANVPVSDLDRARRFYADTLGLTPSDENPGGLIYTTEGGTTFFLYQTEYAG